MDDMTPTDKLRALLDERGIEHDDNDLNTEVTGVRITRWKNGGKRDVRYEEWRNGTTRLDAGNVSPEQAIAATVTTEPDEATMLKLHGRMNAVLLDMQEELLAYHPRDLENATSKELIDCVIRAHQIIEDAATGVGTCKAIDTGYATAKCSECGAEFMGSIMTNEPPDYVKPLERCPRCGRRIIEEDE